ncbi:hypothetical protein [Actinoplanes sp. DH11]|uniref:hypothetical protein n=1 Tax=Actinoplanes sp. DH11 TaxID=2857011 RepID=UPI001E4B07A9|nr:hypothetical protein [Actinoplanes sp. DH11]
MQLTKLNKAGLVIALLLGLIDVTGPFTLVPENSQDGPPFAILLIDCLLGLITVAAVVVAWRTGRRGAVRIAAGARIISVITALPAFFVDVPAALQMVVAVAVALTIASVAMMLAPSRRPVLISD